MRLFQRFRGFLNTFLIESEAFSSMSMWPLYNIFPQRLFGPSPPLEEHKGSLLRCFFWTWKGLSILYGTMHFYKLTLRGCNIFLVRIIYSFLNDRTFQVSIGKSKSSVCNIPYVVPQGAVLSPTLYNFFTSDVSTVDGCVLATFADDPALFVSSSDPTAVCGGLQGQLDSLTDYFKRWKIKVNSSKTQAIYFTRGWIFGRRSRQ
jgi:hypothetical protein